MKVFAIVVCGWAGLFASLACAEDVRMTQAEMAGLDGLWELKVDTKSGWKGTIQMEVEVQDEAGRGGYANYRFHTDYNRGPEREKGRNVRNGRVAALKQGPLTKLVVLRGATRPFQVDAKPETTLAFTLQGDELTLDGSTAQDAFVVPDIAALDLDWKQLRWKRVQK